MIPGLFKRAVAPLWSISMMVTQFITKTKHPVTVYSSIEEITKATYPLKWVSDPWNGKLDVVYSPTKMQEAIDLHPDNAGDCDDFAAYWCCALLKSKLVSEVWMGAATWSNGGHAVCVYRVGEKWFWVGNWRHGVPFEVPAGSAWHVQLAELRKVKLIYAGMCRAIYNSGDILTFDKFETYKL
jgi:hypothetical protein